MIDLGDQPVDTMLRIPFSTFDSDGGSVTMTSFTTADIEIYKDGSVTERTGVSGLVATTDFDGKTGIHLCIIDLSDDDDAGFFAAGSEYHVHVGDVTVDGQTVRFFIARFTIEVANGALARIKAGVTLGTDAVDAAALAADAAVEIAAAVWDRVINAGNHNIGNSAGRVLRLLQESGDYALGAVWLDTVNGTAGSDDFEHGTVNNPTNLIASALILASSLNLHRIAVIGGSTVALGATVQTIEMIGIGRWTLDLDGRDIAGSVFRDAAVTGISTGAGTQVFDGCFMGAVTLPDDTHVLNSGIMGLQTLPAGDIFYDSCHSAVAGLSAPVFDMGSAVGATNLNIRHYSGGVDLRNHGASGADLTSIEGKGQVIFNANCTGGTIVVRGAFTITDNGSATVVLTANVPTLVDAVKAETAIIAADVVNIDGSSIPAMVGTDNAALASAWTATRAGYVDELGPTNIPADVDTLLTRLSALRAGYLDELAAANMPTDIAAIFSRLGAPAGASTAADIAALKVVADAIKAKTDNQPAGVPKNSALANLPFLMVDATDFATPEIGLAVTAEISKDGAAFGAAANAVAEVGSGVYTLSLTAAEMNADTVALKFTAAGAMQRTIVLVTSS